MGEAVNDLTEEQLRLLAEMSGYDKAAVLMLSLNEDDAEI